MDRQMPRQRQDGARSLSSPWPRPHAFSFAPCLRPVLPFELSQAEKTSLGTCQEAYGSAWRDGGGGAAATSQQHAAADVCKASALGAHGCTMALQTSECCWIAMHWRTSDRRR